MRYLGGKVKIARWVQDVVRAHRGDCDLYLEPFVGGAGTFARIAPDFPLCAAGDAHEDLILMWAALRDGWVPPESVTPEDYARLRNEPPSPLRGLVGFGASYGGKWFGGYARGEGRNYFQETREAVLRDSAAFRDAVIEHCSFASWSPGPGVLVYCDPPYAGTTGYSVGSFDHAAFWAAAERWTQAGAVVLVSEETAPDGWAVVAERERRAQVGPERHRPERIYRRAA